MKKILSILLAMVMIVSSITVAFVTIAAAPIEENVEKINTQTAYIADAKNADGTVAASGEFFFDANMEKMYLTVTSDGKIVADTIYE